MIKMRVGENTNKRWTIEEDMTLEIHWGNYKVSTIAKKLGRSVRAIEHRAVALGLGGMIGGSGHLGVPDVVDMLGVNKSTVWKWIKTGGLKARKVILKKKGFYIITMEDLINWLRENPKRWHSGKMEVGCLGLEVEKEEWLIEKRKADSKTKRKREAYTPSEDRKILELYLKGLNAKQIAEEVNRPYEGVKHRIIKIRNENENVPYKNAKTHILKKAI